MGWGSRIVVIILVTAVAIRTQSFIIGSGMTGIAIEHMTSLQREEIVIEGARPEQGILSVTLITIFAVSGCHMIGIFGIVIIILVTGKTIGRQ